MWEEKRWEWDVELGVLCLSWIWSWAVLVLPWKGFHRGNSVLPGPERGFGWDEASL